MARGAARPLCLKNRRRAMLEGPFTTRLSDLSDGGTTMRRLERDVERLVDENQKLVHFQVNRYLQRYFVGDMEREDLVSWGLIGLVQAARAWDPERSGCFSTLACRAIERMIIRGVRREWKPERAASTVSLDEAPSVEETGGQQERFVQRVSGDPD